MINKIKKLFASKEGRLILNKSKETITRYSMIDDIKKGVFVGFSGGADSVMLLSLLSYLRDEYGGFTITAVHVNHSIRGEEADRDAKFAEDFAVSLGVKFKIVVVDIPKLAKQYKLSTEECARNERYRIFDELISSHETASVVAVAHNSTDNLETVIINLMRGAGTAGMVGIPPKREGVIRPLIDVSKEQIHSALDSFGIPYVTDSTNLSCDYTRNYIRNNILPLFKRINEEPEKMASRMSENVRCDLEFIDECANDFIKHNFVCGKIDADKLLSIHKSLFVRVIRHIVAQKTNRTVEKNHIDAIFSLLNNKNFSYSLPGKVRFVSQNGVCFVENDESKDASSFNVTLQYGVNKIDGYSSVILVSDDGDFNCYSNIYKISIRAKLSTDIISNGLSVRSRKDGDSYSYGGKTRKLKKLFNDKSIPVNLRKCVPVFEDRFGIVWVCGFGIRSRKEQKIIHVAVAEPITSNDADLEKMFILSPSVAIKEKGVEFT